LRRRVAGLSCLVPLAAAACTGGGDPAADAPPTGAAAHRVALTGDLKAHDPSLAVVGSDWYVLSTGDAAVDFGTVQIRRVDSTGKVTFLGTVFDAIPAWVKKAVPGVDNLWAPEVFLHDGTYHLYYSGSTFGSNRSVIGLATNTTLDPDSPGYRWVDRGLVIESREGDDFNAIDPGVVEDERGEPYLAFGSFWSGIRQVRLQWPAGKPVAGQGPPARLADRNAPPNAVEAPYLVRHDGWYYLFVSFDLCCRGADSTYKIAVGRSRSVTGPFTDRSGRPLTDGGGTVLLASEGAVIGPGGASVAGDLIAYHYYNGDKAGEITLAVGRITWEPQGWPRLTSATITSS
jgi:arabinan endo-1,5-alpha-L-arabinosidase